MEDTLKQAKKKSIFFADDANTSSNDLSSFTKRSTVKAPANAREGELSQMEDTDSEQKYQEIIELLVTGGYFRARIQGLSPFDKVVGGMAWSITASNVDVDGDLFFQENSNIRQKIALSEELIKSLRRMKCPFPLQAQQIQGLNYPNLFPIIRWLIAKVIETREETGDLLRIYSENASCAFVHQVENRYKPSRKFRKAAATTGSTATPQETLLEYGKLHRLSRVTPSSGDKSAAAAKLEQALGQDKDGGHGSGEADEEEKRIQKMMKSMSGVDSQKINKISGGILKSVVATDEINDLAHRYSEMDVDGPSGKAMGEKLHRQKVAALDKQISQRQEELKRIAKLRQELQERVDQLQNDLAKRQAFNARIIAETEKLDALETPENTKMLQALRSLVLLNETLVAQEQMFKDSCKKQMLEYKAKIEELVKGGGGSAEDEDDAERRQQIEEAFEADLEKFKKLKQLLNKKNRDISLLQRYLDELPSRAELLQYQRQFIELSEQSDAKLTETRQYYTTYNTLDDKRQLLDNELSILQSIQTKYNVAMSSKTNKEMFIKSMDNIIAGIQEVLSKSEGKRAHEKSKHTSLSDQYITLVEQERNYYKYTKEFQEECRKNEVLQSTLSELTAQ
ncbi:hypothetical protein DFA_03405 [Cavenderia fasciculata]|uniref:CCDC93 coiled-coil domain-containing protein n=1 Tax=Cavenderia fasciculata TaxID=261658 RepID=F4PHH3_CACFS|nr:uncharacterized protein DFA_03405 [Cavenderia fasciculata]EGG25157.1 hypothetical protein DFA_03405 [Cavenderia fasciculata]|eukprot:XP_004363008.1 hypothetical protein DFA_03405 [Cavenderia fasciculata]